MNISGRTAIVTGAGRGIGRAIACELAKQGAKVVCVSRTEEHLHNTINLIRDKDGIGLAIPTDVTDRIQVEAMVAQTIEVFGQVDVLVNNAAAFRAIGGLWEVAPDTWWSDVTINLLGPFLCCHSVLPHMMAKNGGIIINMTGGGFAFPNLGGSGYGSSKAALMRLTDTLAFELGERYNIQVYGLDPGFVRSSMTELLATDKQGRRWLSHVKKGLNAHEDHPAEDVAYAIVNLIEISCPLLSGRIFTYNDNFEEIAQRAKEIKEHDLYQLRLRSCCL